MRELRRRATSERATDLAPVRRGQSNGRETIAGFGALGSEWLEVSFNVTSRGNRANPMRRCRASRSRRDNHDDRSDAPNSPRDARDHGYEDERQQARECNRHEHDLRPVENRDHGDAAHERHSRRQCAREPVWLSTQGSVSPDALPEAPLVEAPSTERARVRSESGPHASSRPSRCRGRVLSVAE
jgi:hypothetical protein